MIFFIFIELFEFSVAPLITDDDQLYIFEAAAILIISGCWEPSRKELMLRQILSPIFTKVTCLLDRLAHEEDPIKQVNDMMILITKFMFIEFYDNLFSKFMIFCD